MKENGSETSREGISAFFSGTNTLFFICVAVFIFLQLFILPFTPFYFEGDHMLPISNAMRLLDGEVMYRDFFHFTPPGTDLYYAAAFYFFGTKIWILNATVFLLAIAQMLLIFAFSRKLLSGVFVYLPTLLYFLVGFRLYGIDGSNRLFSVVFVLLAALLVMCGRPTRMLLAAGAFCGLSSFFVQTRGVLGVGAIGLFLLWVHWRDGFEFRLLIRDWLYASVGFLVVVAVTQIPAAYWGGFDNYFFANFTFLKDYYGADTLSNTFAYFSDLPRFESYSENYGAMSGFLRYLRVAGPALFLYAIVPLTYIVYFIYRRMRQIETRIDEGLMLLSILGCVLFIGASAPTAFRLYHISIPAILLLCWLLSRVLPNKIAVLATGALGLLLVSYSIQRQVADRVDVNFPAGRTAFLSANVAEKYQWFSGQVNENEAVYEAIHPSYYFPLHLKNPTPFYLVRDNNYTPDFQVKQLMEALEKNPPRFIIWHGIWSKEANERREGDNLAPLWEFIRKNYELRKEFRESGEFTTNSERDTEFWEKPIKK
ncbi:MAG: hypothetical protein ACRD6X_14375 [Pyrinomonadaceae bacterium]